LFHISVYCKSLAGQVFRRRTKEIEITEPHTKNQTCDWISRCGWEFMDHLPCIFSLGFSVFQLFGPLKKHLDCKLFAAKANVKQSHSGYRHKKLIHSMPG